MAITKKQIQIVQQTFIKVLPISDLAAHLFYSRLFQIDPSLKPMFKGDMQEQGRKLMQMIGMTVQGLSVPGEIMGLVADLGRKHLEYGVIDAHYDTVRTALLWTLGQGLGVDFTPEAKAAWTEAYEFLAKVMKDAAAEQTHKIS
jgi:hemoglobin-like flavoprotein